MSRNATDFLKGGRIGRIAGSNSLRWWTRSQSIRTEGEIPFEVALVDPSAVPTYIVIAPIASQLHELKMNRNQIAVALKVDRTTVVRALRWVKSIPVYVSGRFPEV
jgi:hypothetical protein